MLHNACRIEGKKKMIGPELYMRVVTNRKGSEKHYRRLEEYDPGSGTVRVLRLTERQYQI